MIKKFLVMMMAIMFVSGIVCGYAQEKFDAEQQLPAKTLLYASLTNGKKFLEELKTTGIFQLFSSQEWQDFFKTIPPQYLEEFHKNKAMAEDQFGIQLETLLSTLEGQISLSVAGVAEGRMPLPQVAFTWDLGEQKEVVAKFLVNLRQQLFRMDRKFKEDTTTIGKYEVSIIATPLKVPVYLTYKGTTLILCSDRNLLDTLLADGPTQDNLAGDAQYQHVKKQLLQDRAGKLLYLNFKEIRQLAIEKSGRKGKEIEQMLAMVGLDSINAAGFGLSACDGQVVEALYAYTPQGRTGLLGSILPTTQNEGKLTPFIPDNLLGLQHGFIDFAGIYQSLTGLMQQVAPREYQGFMEMKKGIEAEFGLSLEEDVLKVLGNEFLITINFSGGLLPDVALQLTLQDTEKFRALMDKMLTIVPKQYQYPLAWNGHNFVYFNFSTMSQPIPIAPTLVIEDGRLLVTLFPESAKNLLIKTNGQLPSDCVKCLNGRPYTVVKYSNLKAVLVPIYRTLVPLVQAMTPRAQVPLELGLLPSGQLLETHLTNAVELGMLDNQGVLWEVHSPVGLLSFVVPASIAGAALVPKRSYNDRPPFPRPPIERPVEKIEPSVVSQPSGDAIKGSLVAIEESRTWKSSAPELESVLQNVWINKSAMNLKLFVQIPQNTVGYGGFQFSHAQDNKGQSLMPEDESLKNIKKFYAYDLTKIAEGKGYEFQISLPAPQREANQFSLKGNFTIRLAGEAGQINLENFAKCRDEEREVTEIPDLTIKFTKNSRDTSLNLLVTGDIFKISGISVVNGEAVEKSTGWSSYSADEKTTNISYYYNSAIPDNATIQIEYLKSIEDKSVTIDIENQQLP